MAYQSHHGYQAAPDAVAAPADGPPAPRPGPLRPPRSETGAAPRGARRSGTAPPGDHFGDGK